MRCASTPGFTLFRRSSSRVANPTTQGVTLRGVSGSGSSRTLVLADGVPLNDPFGSWVYWNRIPLAAVDRVEVVRGATGDLYGAGALGGVVQLLTVQPSRTRARATFDGGSHDTFRGSLFGAAEKNGWNASGAYEGVRTDGAYVLAPEVRGPVDTRADSDYKTGLRDRRHAAATTGTSPLRGAGYSRGSRTTAPSSRSTPPTGSQFGRRRRHGRRRRARSARRRQLAGLLPDVLRGGRRAARPSA